MSIGASMKSSTPLTIYIATSASRNLYAYMLLRDRLVDMGHRVLDWAKLLPPLPAGTPAGERRAAINSDEYGKVFDFCAEAAASADLVIYLGPAGQDAAAEIGMAYNAGVCTYGLQGVGEELGTILGRAVERWFTSYRDLLAAVEELAQEEEEEEGEGDI